MTLFSDRRAYDTAFIPEVDKKNAKEFEKEFGESFLDNWHYQTYTGNSYSRTDNLHDEFGKDIEEIEKITGEKLKNPYNSAMKEFFVEDIALGIVDEAIKNPFDQKSSRFHPENIAKREQSGLNDYYKKVDKLKSQFPELKTRDIETINQSIKKQAAELYQKVNDGRNSSMLGDFFGSAAGTMIDPINATATLVTGGGNAGKTTIAKALGKTALGEFILNSGIEAVIQPSVYEYKKELDIPYSKTEAAMNVVAAGVGGAVLGTATKALSLGSKELLGRYKKAKAKGFEFDGKTQEAAALLESQVEFDEWATRSNPYGDSIEADVLHKRKILDEERRLTEEMQLSTGYESIKENPVGKAMEVLAEIAPEDMETVWVNRGGYSGNNSIKGSGFGMVKFIFKHGEKSTDTSAITKADVVDFPRIVREFEPIIDDIYGSNRTWSVKRADGEQVTYADRIFNEDGERHLVTIHTATEKDHKLKDIFSEEKSRREAKPAHTMDTTQKTFSRTDESSAEASSPKSRFQGGGDTMDNIISTLGEKVKDAEGNPLVVYHGTALNGFKSFDVFKPLSWFTEDKKYAKVYASSRKENLLSRKKYYKANLYMKKPFDIGDTDSGFTNRIDARDDFYKYLSEKLQVDIKEIKKSLDEAKGGWIHQVVNSEEFMNLLKKHGFDGIKAIERGHRTYAVFNNKQIELLGNGNTQKINRTLVDMQHDLIENTTENTPININDYKDLDLTAMEKNLSEDTSLTPEEKAFAQEEIEKMRHEEAWDNEIIDCILEFKQR